jgi:hypothetical protein
MLPIFDPTACANAPGTHAGSASDLPSAPADTMQENGPSTDERAATYEELMPYLVLAMASGI